MSKNFVPDWCNIIIAPLEVLITSVNHCFFSATHPLGDIKKDVNNNTGGYFDFG